MAVAFVEDALEERKGISDGTETLYVRSTPSFPIFEVSAPIDPGISPVGVLKNVCVRSLVRSFVHS